MTFRSRPFLDLAHRVHQCQIRLPGICVGYSPEGCEPAHANLQELGKGMGHKASDLHVAACHQCHAELDSGRRFSKAEKRDYWLIGQARTVLLYLERGLLKVTA